MSKHILNPAMPSSFAAAATVALLIAAGACAGTLAAVAAPANPASAPAWAASATGRVEPRSGELRLLPQTQGRIVQVAVGANDDVVAGEMLVRLDDDDALAKISGTNAEAEVRQRERDEEQASGPAQERRAVEDAVAASERAVTRARLALDAATLARRTGQGNGEAVANARAVLIQATEKLAADRTAHQRVMARTDLPLPTRLETALTIARAELSAAETALDRTRVRAPIDGIILNIHAKVGELAAPSPEMPLIVMGDVSRLRVRAEAEERDAPKIRSGQGVVVRSDAHPNVDFKGVVTSVARTLAAPRIIARGPRRPADLEVLEVMADLEGNPPLLTGMRVDVFFKHDQADGAIGQGMGPGMGPGMGQGMGQSGQPKP